MINAMAWLVKFTLFSILILVLGNWIQWDGKSVSDQVKTQISHAERSNFASSFRRWTGNVAQDMRSGATHKSARHKNEARPKDTSYQETADASSPTENSQPASPDSGDTKPMEKIRSSERQKLRALIQELNTSTSADRRGAH